MKNFKLLDPNYNIATLANSIPNVWNFYPVDKIRKQLNPAVDSITIRFNDINDPIESTECEWLPVTNIWPFRKFVENNARGTAIGRVIIARLNPLGTIDEHTDEGGYSDSYNRYHLCLSGYSIFRSGDESVTMVPGQLWYINNHVPHSVKNLWNASRVNLIFDIERSYGY